MADLDPATIPNVITEVEGVVMIDEGYTEVPSDTPTCFATWPLLRAEVPKILTNNKVPLMADDEDAMLAAYVAGTSASPVHANSEQEHMEALAHAFREWRAA